MREDSDFCMTVSGLGLSEVRVGTVGLRAWTFRF